MALNCEEQIESNKTGEIFLSDLQKTLQEELTCPICHDLIKNTMVLVECIHRFCSNCITKALLPGNEECPVCKKKIEGKSKLKKHLVPDPNFDELINMVFAIPSKKRCKTLQNKVTDDNSEYVEENEIELILKVHPSASSIDSTVKISRDVIKYVKVVENATIDHIKKYLTMRINLDDSDLTLSFDGNSVNVSMYIDSGNGQFVLLDAKLTLKEVADRFWDFDKPLELYYSITKDS